MFQSVNMITALKMAYVVFPSVSSAKAIFNELNGTMSLNGRDVIEVAYSTNSLRSNILENAPAQFETGSGSYNDPTHITAN